MRLSVILLVPGTGTVSRLTTSDSTSTCRHTFTSFKNIKCFSGSWEVVGVSSDGGGEQR